MHPYEHLITFAHLNRIRETMVARKATKLWLGIMGGKGEYAEPHFQLGSKNGEVVAFDRHSYAPSRERAIWEPDHLFPAPEDAPMSLSDLDAMMARVRARVMA
jgi:hypothetical protein